MRALHQRLDSLERHAVAKGSGNATLRYRQGETLMGALERHRREIGPLSPYDVAVVMRETKVPVHELEAVRAEQQSEAFGLYLFPDPLVVNIKKYGRGTE